MIDKLLLEEAALALEQAHAAGHTAIGPLPDLTSENYEAIIGNLKTPGNDGTERTPIERTIDAIQAIERLLRTDEDQRIFREKFPKAAQILDETNKKIAAVDTFFRSQSRLN